MLTVIADDITGAAEVAGIAFRYGLRTVLSVDAGSEVPDCDVWVIATDTRSMSEAEAAAESKRITEKLWKAGAQHIFKKTDSALRGHVVAELHAITAITGHSLAIYIPCNPSKGRTIKNGKYFINGKPLHKTSFAEDPEFPAHTSDVVERLHIKDCDNQTPVCFFDADSEERIADIVAEWTEMEFGNALFAGAADLFSAYINIVFSDKRTSQNRSPKPFSGLKSERTLIVCGSTQSQSLTQQPFIIRHNISESRMPIDVFDGKASAEDWAMEAETPYSTTGGIILTIAQPSQGGKDVALRLRQTMAETVEKLVQKSCPEELIIEGGATAYAVLNALQWHNFRLTDEVAPGVVRMQTIHPTVIPSATHSATIAHSTVIHSATTIHSTINHSAPTVHSTAIAHSTVIHSAPIHITLKPGSYNWGNLFAE